MMRDALLASTSFSLPGQRDVYHGKVRDVYDLGDSLMMVATDRYSAFDRHDLVCVPHKGELLTGISRWWFKQTQHIIPNHILGRPDPNVTWCKKYKVVPIEMIVRGYITGITNTSLWYTYSQGQRDFGAFTLPDGLHKNDKLPESVVTPTTKFERHDRPITPEQAIQEGLIDPVVWEDVKKVALQLFAFGQKTAESKGLILVDTKYEFGQDENGQIVLIDELHIPDSSRYWRADSYKQRLKKGEEPDNYDKEFLRLWYKDQFDPYTGKTPPTPPKTIVDELQKRYVFVYESLTGKTFTPRPDNIAVNIEKSIVRRLKDKDA